MNNELAVEILKQATIETTTGACEKCPRKDKNKTCIGCLDEAKEIILSEVERLDNELQVQIEDNTRLNEYIEEQDKKLQQKENIIKEVREYIENNSLYEQDYDYDYEENLVEYPPSDEQARKDILSILDKENSNGSN